MKKLYMTLALATAVGASALAGVKTADQTNAMSAQNGLAPKQAEMVLPGNDGRQKELNYTTADQIAGEYILYCNSGFDQDDHEGTVYIAKGSADDEVIVYGFWNGFGKTATVGGIGVKGTVKNEGGKCTITFIQQKIGEFEDGPDLMFYPYNPFTGGGVTDNMVITVCPYGVSYTDGTSAYSDGCLAVLSNSNFFISNPTIIGEGRGYSLLYNIILCPVELYGSETQQLVNINEADWKSVGTGKFTDGYIYPLTTGQVGAPYDVPVMQKNDGSNVFLVKNPYGTGTPNAQYNSTPDAAGYIYIDATNPEIVLVRPLVYSGLDDQDGWEGRLYMANEEGAQYFLDESTYEDIADYFDYYEIPMSTMAVDGNNVTINIRNGGIANVCDFFSYVPWTNTSGNTIPCESTLTFSLDNSGVSTIATENGVKRFFNLQGLEIAQPEAGQVVIVRENGKSTKTIIR